MVATRNLEPRVLDDALRNAVIGNFAREELGRISNGDGISNMEGSNGRLTKVDFPKFNRDVNGWLELVESYAVSLFIGILKNEISMPVRMQEATLAFTKAKSMLQLVVKDLIIIVMQGETTYTSTSNLALQHLLITYADVFEMSTKLPPQMTHDHAITLLPNTLTITVRPYRLPPNQKDVLEQMHLNKFTVKDKISISVVEELIDELCGAQIFSKLDLRYGYHHIRMKEEDIYKKAFITHQGHYEFLVMPFGLTNAPSTFQSLINQVFKPFLRKFVLVFFDDILIYSHNEAEHLRHLQEVLEVMRAYTLYAKQSNCTFLAPQVEYLGHVLSSQGVATDPLKIQAINSWLIPTTLKQLKDVSLHSAKISNDDNLPNFEKEFVVETKASDGGMGVVLHQDGHPIAYLSKALSPAHLSFSTYEK
ncbi:putative mitochondrial protein [Tanacetum coccineum]|uniref:Mitochondrial protein n=1 Tax=Tanacetum coccineum TaxID=301880 RepID=A0ABQ5E9F9_9ASTR